MRPLLPTEEACDGRSFLASGEADSCRQRPRVLSPPPLRGGTNQQITGGRCQLKQVCEEHLAGRYEIEVIDLLRTPRLAAGDQILAVPTLVRRLPAPLKRIIGTLSDTERVLVGLDIRPKAGGRELAAD